MLHKKYSEAKIERDAILRQYWCIGRHYDACEAWLKVETNDFKNPAAVTKKELYDYAYEQEPSLRKARETIAKAEAEKDRNFVNKRVTELTDLSKGLADKGNKVLDIATQYDVLVSTLLAVDPSHPVTIKVKADLQELELEFHKIGSTLREMIECAGLEYRREESRSSEPFDPDEDEQQAQEIEAEAPSAPVEDQTSTETPEDAPQGEIQAVEAPLPEESLTVKAIREAFSHNPKGLEVRRGTDRFLLVDVVGTDAKVCRFAQTGSLLKSLYRVPLKEISLPEAVEAPQPEALAEAPTPQPEVLEAETLSPTVLRLMAERMNQRAVQPEAVQPEPVEAAQAIEPVQAVQAIRNPFSGRPKDLELQEVLKAFSGSPEGLQVRHKFERALLIGVEGSEAVLRGMGWRRGVDYRAALEDISLLEKITA